LEELIQVSDKWYLLGLRLNVHPGTLDSIRQEYLMTGTVSCLCGMLQAWLKSTKPYPTWKALIDGLRSETVREMLLGEQLKGKYAADRQSTCTGSSNSSGIYICGITYYCELFTCIHQAKIAMATEPIKFKEYFLLDYTSFTVFCVKYIHNSSTDSSSRAGGSGPASQAMAGPLFGQTST